MLLTCAGAWAQPVQQKLGAGVARWFPSKEAAANAVPSQALLNQPKSPAEAASDARLKPEYDAGGERLTAHIGLSPGDSLYGVGRDRGALLRNGNSFGGLPVDTPWVLCVHEDGTAFGVFADSTYATGVDLSKDISISSDDPRLPLVIIEGASPMEVVVQLNQLTGRMEMPPLWALGYQHFAAYGDVQLKHAAEWLRGAQIPAAGLWVGVHPNTWPINYPKDFIADAKATAEFAKENHFRLLGLIGKAIPDIPEAVIMKDAIEGKHLLLQTDGNYCRDEVADIPHLFIDFSRKRTRDWWSGLAAKMLEPGWSGFVSSRWHPERFGSLVKLDADEDLGGPDTAFRYQLTLDTQFARATWDGFGGEASNRRPFNMIDARAIGAQRYTGAFIDWPSTEQVDWPERFTGAALSSSLSGAPFVGTLVKPPLQGEGSEKNLRWMGVAAMFPMVAGSFFLPDDLSNMPQEGQKVLRQAMERRARFIPYLYTLCFNGFFACEPILRPLFFDDPKDPALRANEQGFLVGKDLLVVPRPGAGFVNPMPLKGSWHKLNMGEQDDKHLPDLYIRPGAIIPLGPLMQYPDEKPLDPITIVANPDESGVAQGFLYEDAGDGYEFYHNRARRIGYRVTREGDAYMVRLSNLDFGLPLPDRKLQIRILTGTTELTGEGSEKGTVRIPIPPTPAPPAPESPKETAPGKPDK